MKAILFTAYGSPDVLQFKEVDRPAPAPGEVLVKVYAAAANPLDWHFMRGAPFIARLGNGLRKPKNHILGADLAGEVIAVGQHVTAFQPGDQVFGEIGLGAFAEYVCVKERSLALKPANVSFEQAASVPVVGFTAVQGLRDFGKVAAGQKVLVNGASGGVGSFAVQYAKAMGAEVTGVCSARNLELVRSIGADHVLDYAAVDFTANGQKYDLIYDAIGNRSVGDYRRALKPGGRCVVAGFISFPRMLTHAIWGGISSKFSDAAVGIMGSARPNQADLLVIKDLLETGKIVPVIDRHYPLSQTADAIRYLETGRARGKVIINIAPASELAAS
ncbi:MAG: NAD(P)-dependent alcohol dehydrogenase [Anaerolineae bacterium]|nr:NAD(P)-dependent alcohol dehydrogenase [Anaerolineae bacterium]